MSKTDPLNTTNPRKRKLSKFSEQQITELKIACSMSSMHIGPAGAETILLVLDGIKRYGGDFDLYTASRITAHIIKKYSPKKKKKK